MITYTNLVLEEIMKIKEIIVVEGKDDTAAIKKAVEADTIETSGSAINKETLELIKHAKQTRGVIIFTDPDYPGQRIRSIVSDYVPGCKHAFITKEEAVRNGKKGLGIEHASREVIQKALQDVKEVYEERVIDITKDDLIDAGLIGHPKASERREKLGKLLKIGYTNGKQLEKRLQMFQITKEAFIEAVRKVLTEE